MNLQNGPEVEAIVDDYLKRLQPQLNTPLNPHVIPGSGVISGNQNNWWYVSVETDLEPARKFEYYDFLAKVEEQIQQERHVDVQLVPLGVREDAQR